MAQAPCISTEPKETGSMMDYNITGAEPKLTFPSFFILLFKKMGSGGAGGQMGM